MIAKDYFRLSPDDEEPDRGTIGLITTHDLALTAVADELSTHGANVHFQDWFEGNEIKFDYLMKPGRSREAMRSP